MRLRSTKGAPFMVWPDMQGAPQWRMIDLQSYIDDGFSLNTLIYEAVMYKARASVAPPLRAYEGSADKPVILPESHPLAKLVSRPNPSQSWSAFQMRQNIFLNMAGEAITWFDRRNSSQGVPAAAYSLNPMRTYIVPKPGASGKASILGYLYVPLGKAISDGTPLLPQDISHVKLPNPADPLDGEGYGFSPMSPLARSADVDNMITKFLQVFFKNGAVPAGLLTFDVPMDDIAAARVKEQWREMYGGFENWGEVAVLDKVGKYQRVGMNFEELGFDGIDERNESRIVGPFGVPLILIGSRLGLLRSTYANFKEARQQFWEDTMLAEMGLFESSFKYYMQSDNGGFVAYDYSQVPALRKDTPMLVTAWSQLFDRGVPRAEAAITTGLTLPDLPDNHVSYMPMTMIPVGGAMTTTNTAAGQAGATNETRTGGKELLVLANELKLARETLEKEEKG